MLDLPPGARWIARSASGRVRWFDAKEALILPEAGPWRVSAVGTGDEGPPTWILAVNPDDVHAGRWSGPARLSWLGDRAELIQKDALIQLPPRPGRLFLDGEQAELGIAVAQGARAGVAPTPLQNVSLTRGTDGNVSGKAEFSVPMGTQVWAWVHDGSDLRAEPPFHAPRLAEAPSVAPGLSWTPPEHASRALAAGLLAEEERTRESQQKSRINLYSDLLLAEELIDGSGGYGMGGGGMGSRGMGSGTGSMGRAETGRELASPASLPGALARYEGQGEGWTLRLPASVTAVWVQGVAQLGEQGWTSFSQRIFVEGTPIPSAPPTAGARPQDSLFGIAATLTGTARGDAFAALAVAGDVDAMAALRAGAPVQLAPALYRNELSVTELGWGGDSSLLNRLGSLPDAAVGARAALIIAAAAANPEQSAVAARRVLRSPNLDDWSRGRAILGLWAGGGEAEELDAALGSGGAALPVRMAATIMGKRADIKDQPELLALAVAEGALPSERALAIAAVSRLPKTPVQALPAPSRGTPVALTLTAEPAIAEWEGVVFRRGYSALSTATPRPMPGSPDAAVGRITPLLVELPPQTVPGRLQCPSGPGFLTLREWIELEATTVAQHHTCELRPLREGPLSLTARWYAADGQVVGTGTVSLVVGPTRSPSANENLSPDERLGLGVALARAGDAAGFSLLDALLTGPSVSADALRRAAAARVEGAVKLKDPERLVEAFEEHRERAPDAVIPVEHAAAVARAYAAIGRHDRALAAVRVVEEYNFVQQFTPVRLLHEAGQTLTSLKLLHHLLAEAPPTQAAVEARIASATMFLGLADGEGDRLGLTRSSLRTTAVADLASYLLMAPDGPSATNAALRLLGALERLDEPERAAVLAPGLAARYAGTPEGASLALFQARALHATGKNREALRLLESRSIGDLERGRVLVALNRHEEAAEAWRRLSSSEGQARAAQISKVDPTLPTLIPLRDDELRLGLRPGARYDVSAWALSLERLLLRNSGNIDPDSVTLEGLPVGAQRTGTVDSRGALALPRLAPGAWLVSLRVDHGPSRRVVVLTDALDVSLTYGGDGALLVVRDHDGAPVGDAGWWEFSDGVASPGRADSAGYSWLPGGTDSVLVRAGSGPQSRWGWVDGQHTADPEPAPMQALESLGYLGSANAYGNMLRMDASIRNNAL